MAVHHIIVFIQEPGGNNSSQGGGTGGNLLVGYAPGEPAMELEKGTARLVKAGSKLR